MCTYSRLVWDFDFHVSFDVTKICTKDKKGSENDTKEFDVVF
jgi:hypothetical protein